MHVILTHEQADFDAVASMLGAYLLDDSAFPVLPRRLNRNLKSYLLLYGSELPFIEAADLPQQPIKDVTLVDTQSMITLKGMTKKTRIHVIDHHQERSDIPDEWNIRVDSVGAATTLFVEELQHRGMTLTLIQATLLLLGIYEDTGSLSYPGTTPRDIRAAAFLVDEGASLQIATNYLNPPLTIAQREVYDRLLSSTQTINIQGQRVIIACANAEPLSEEVSTIAHKLGDLLDPDALFMLVKTSDGVRLVARANNDQINVAAISAHFGGGGHSKAAAALIRSDVSIKNGDELLKACQDLMSILPTYIQPQLTVGQIMSKKPHLLSPDTLTSQAVKLMQRYGYEGFPVVRDNKVIGLLTRRGVDRAIAHKLNLTADKLMEAGSFFVHPNDSLQTLQQLMIDSGWGQIPVVDETENRVIGIVTRTDLLKTISNGELQIPGRLNIARQLETALPPARLILLHMVADQARLLRSAVYIVGGFVRDLLIGRPSLDFDLVIEGDAIALAKSLASQYGGNVTTHSRFGTAKWKTGGIRKNLVSQMNLTTGLAAEDIPDSLDFISARSEFYDYPSALPQVEHSNIKHDLHRRDFSINTMALRLDGRHYGELYDYWGGYRDLQRSLVRVLHSLSFVDDPTRMLRAVRFEQRFDFQIEKRTMELIVEAGPLLKQVTGARLRHELDLILTEDKAGRMLTRLSELKLLEAIHPKLIWDPALEPLIQEVVSATPDRKWEIPDQIGTAPAGRILAYLVWLITYHPQDAAAIAERLNFPGELRKALQSGCRVFGELTSLFNSPVSKVVERFSHVPHMALFAIYKRKRDGFSRLIENYIDVWQHVQPQTRGNDLLAMGLKPGPEFSQILETLKAAWLDGKITNKKQEKQFLDDLVISLPHRQK